MTSFGWWRDDEPVRFTRNADVRDAAAVERGLERQAWNEIDHRWGLLTTEDVTAVQIGTRTPEMITDITGKYRIKHALADSERNQIRKTSQAKWLARQADLAKVLSVGTPLYPERRMPGFQFSPSGLVLAAISNILVLTSARWTPEITTLWLDAPNGWLAGTAPADILETDPGWVLAALDRALPTPA